MNSERQRILSFLVLSLALHAGALSLMPNMDIPTWQRPPKESARLSVRIVRPRPRVQPASTRKEIAPRLAVAPPTAAPPDADEMPIPDTTNTSPDEKPTARERLQLPPIPLNLFISPTQQPPDSTAQFGLGREALGHIYPHSDRVEQEQLKRMRDDRPIPLGDILGRAARALREKKKPDTPRISPANLPSATQVDALIQLWQRGEATDQTLYAGLESTLNIRAEDLVKEMKEMVRRGWVTSKIVSPRNEFVIGIPLGGIPIEMSPKNRRNRVYRYRPVLKRAQLRDALMSFQYLAAQGEMEKQPGIGDVERFKLTVSRRLAQLLNGIADSDSAVSQPSDAATPPIPAPLDSLRRSPE